MGMLAADWLAGRVMLSRLSCVVQDHQAVNNATYSEPGPSISIDDQDSLPQMCPQANLTKTITPLRLFLGDSRLEQVDI